MSAANRYRAKCLVKRGGMAEVFEGQVQGEGGFERRVAIKRLLAQHILEESFLRGFIDEARIASQLHHANIVSIIDFGFADGLPFQVLEFVDGMDLRTIIQASRARRIAIPPELALWIIAEVAHALEYAHGAHDADGQPMGIIHRDVSPENILISWAGDVKLADFGIAYAIKRLEMTRVGIVKGKPDFMAPEQRRGEDVDCRADVFALGRVLQLLASNDRDAARIIGTAIQPLPAHRYQSAADLASACLEAIAERSSGDTRTALCTWLAGFREKPKKDEHPLGALFDLHLSIEAPIEPEGTDTVRRFASVAAVPFDDKTEDDRPEETVTVTNDPSPAEYPDTALSKTALGPTLIRPSPVQMTSSHDRRLLFVLVAAAIVLAFAIGAVGVTSTLRAPEATPLVAIDPEEGAKQPVALQRPESVTPKAEPERTPEVPAEAQPTERQAHGRRADRIAQPPSRAMIADAHKAVVQALASKGLELEDLVGLEGFDDAIRTWRGALATGDGAAAKASADVLVPKVERVTVDRGFVERKLQRFSKKLERSVSSVDGDRLKDLEVRYLDLLSAAADAKTPEQCGKLLAQAAALDRDLDRLRRP
jgi:serine/threonine protein kinase